MEHDFELPNGWASQWAIIASLFSILKGLPIVTMPPAGRLTALTGCYLPLPAILGRLICRYIILDGTVMSDPFHTFLPSTVKLPLQLLQPGDSFGNLTAIGLRPPNPSTPQFVSAMQ